MITYEVINAGTVYRIHVATEDRGRGPFNFICAETGWGRGYGEWMLLDVKSVAWNYVAEKMPILAKREGDKPGWKMAFAKAGIEVFG